MSENLRLQAKLGAIETQVRRMQREVTLGDMEEIDRIRQRHDSVTAAIGERSTEPMQGETPVEYRGRSLARLAAHSPQFSKSGAWLQTCGGNALDGVERAILDSVQTAVMDQVKDKPGLLIAHERLDPGGRKITTFSGDPLAWMSNFMTGAQVGRVIRNPKGE